MLRMVSMKWPSVIRVELSRENSRGNIACSETTILHQEYRVLGPQGYRLPITTALQGLGLVPKSL